MKWKLTKGIVSVDSWFIITENNKHIGPFKAISILKDEASGKKLSVRYVKDNLNHFCPYTAARSVMLY
jgi:hypothetical protein